MHQEVVHEKDHYHPNSPDLLAPYPSYHEYFPLLSVLEILAWHLDVGLILDFKKKKRILQGFGCVCSINVQSYNLN